uniref:Uncharacterized protein n=1 Tax=Plectus sambesii TaxID=2011161 RepID=A0A914VPG9_9BILA
MMVRVAALGESRVGKTALLEQFVHGTCPTLHRPTVVNRSLCCTVVRGDRVYELQCNDLPPMYQLPLDSLDEWDYCAGFTFRTVDVYLLVFDCSRPDTFETVEQLYVQLRRSRPMAPVVVVAAKCDLLRRPPGGGRSINPYERLVRKKWKRPFVECSAKHNCKVSAVFQELMNSVEQSSSETNGRKGQRQDTKGSNRQSRSSPRCVIQ